MNENVLRRVDEEKQMLKVNRTRKLNWLGHWAKRKCLLMDVIKNKKWNVRRRKECMVLK